MPRKRSDADVKRMFFRRVPQLSWGEVESLRDRLTRFLIADKFKRGYSFEQVHKFQKVWTEADIENEIRQYMRTYGTDEA